MIWLGAAAALAAIAISLWLWSKRPVVHHVPPERLKDFVKVLFQRGYPGGFMIVKEQGNRGRERFIQLSKYVASPGEIGLEFAFPLSDWSADYYQKLQDLLDIRGIKYRVERTGRHDTREFLNVDFGKNLDTAEDIARSVLHDVLGLPRNMPVDVLFENVSPREEFIDR